MKLLQDIITPYKSGTGQTLFSAKLFIAQLVAKVDTFTKEIIFNIYIVPIEQEDENNPIYTTEFPFVEPLVFTSTPETSFKNADEYDLYLMTKENLVAAIADYQGHIEHYKDSLNQLTIDRIQILEDKGDTTAIDEQIAKLNISLETANSDLDNTKQKLKELKIVELVTVTEESYEEISKLFNGLEIDEKVIFEKFVTKYPDITKYISA